jgi:hypothetical protein
VVVASELVAKRPNSLSNDEEAVTRSPTAVEVGEIEFMVLKEKSETNWVPQTSFPVALLY